MVALARQACAAKPNVRFHNNKGVDLAFNFEVQGDPRVVSAPLDSKIGVPFPPEEATTITERRGFEPCYNIGAGEERFWHWFFKG